MNIQFYGHGISIWNFNAGFILDGGKYSIIELGTSHKTAISIDQSKIRPVLTLKLTFRMYKVGA